ncbi:MAG TPA: hypothetical protein VFO58_21715, partial [Vicinamibacterales bacterium]|nr:hypothetical protein [Vicinamibacterales bacterium]
MKVVRRGDLVVVTMRGANTGKPRPALVVQSDAYDQTHASDLSFHAGAEGGVRVIQGLISPIPQPVKSSTLRVASSAPWTRAM